MILLSDENLNNKNYGGSSLKFGVTYNNVDYILKFSEDNNFTIYSEYIASRFIAKLGIPVHEVELVNYKGVYSGNEQVCAVALKDFTTVLGDLHEFKDTEQSSENTPLDNKSYTYNDIIDLIVKHIKLVPELKDEMINHFWTQFVCDAILANRDRHQGNWGYIVRKDGKYIPAPIYDNGNSLFPDINSRYLELKALKTKNDYFEFMQDRVYKYPASLIKQYDKKLGRDKRTNYYEMFKDFRKYPQLGKVAKQFTSKFCIEDVFKYVYNIVIDIQGLDNIYKRFYIFIICLRYLCIVCRIPYEKSFETVCNLAEQYGIIKNNMV